MSKTLFYPYTLTIQAPAIITGIGGDPNSAATLDYIPGAMLRGALANRLGDPTGAGKSDQDAELFTRLILSGQVRYLNAYPVDDSLRRSVPMPVSFRRRKYAVLANRGPIDDIVDLSAYNVEQGEPEEQLTGVEAPFVTFSSDAPCSVYVRTSARIHHQRDREKGRPTEERGALFTYESLDSDQVFRGFIAVAAADKSEADRLVQGIEKTIGSDVLLGRSRRAGYGGKAGFAVRRINDKLEPANRELEDGPVLNRDLQPGDIFRVLLLSPYVGRDPDTGQVTPASFFQRLRQALGEQQVQEVNSQLKFALCGGFNQKARLPLPLVLGIQAGSVFVLQATGKIPLDELKSVEAKGLGERLVEGFGRFAFLAAAPGYEGVLQNGEKAVVGAAPSVAVMPEDSAKLLRLMQRRLLLERLDIVLLTAAQEIAGNQGYTIASSLIGRLRVPLRENPGQALQILSAWLTTQGDGALRLPARKKLKNCRLANKQTLHAWLVEMTSANHKLGEDLNLSHLENTYYLVSPEEASKVLSELRNELRVRLIDTVLATIGVVVRGAAVRNVATRDAIAHPQAEGGVAR